MQCIKWLIKVESFRTYWESDSVFMKIFQHCWRRYLKLMRSDLLAYYSASSFSLHFCLIFQNTKTNSWLWFCLFTSIILLGEIEMLNWDRSKWLNWEAVCFKLLFFGLKFRQSLFLFAWNSDRVYDSIHLSFPSFLLYNLFIDGPIFARVSLCVGVLYDSSIVSKCPIFHFDSLK